MSCLYSGLGLDLWTRFVITKLLFILYFVCKNCVQTQTFPGVDCLEQKSKEVQKALGPSVGKKYKRFWEAKLSDFSIIQLLLCWKKPRNLSLKVRQLNFFLEIFHSEYFFKRMMPLCLLIPLAFYIHSILAGLAMNCKYSRTKRYTRKIDREKIIQNKEKKILFVRQ